MSRTITDFTPLENNPNAHTERGYDALEKSISDLGYTEPMVASSDGVILSGNARYEKAGSLLTGEPIIVESDGTRPVIHVRTDIKGDSPQARRIVYASNRVAELDFALDLDVLLADVQAGVDLSGLYTEGELEALLADLMPDEAPDDPGAQVDRAEELRQKWQTQRGQVWQVGRHRVMCGDSTSAEDVARLMGGEKADIVWTDPPYGMDLDTDFSGMESKLFKGKTGGNYHNPVIGDNEQFNPSHIFSTFGYCKEIFLWGADYYAEFIPAKNDGSWVVWDKRLDESADKMWGSAFELCWSKQPHKRDIARIKWAGIFGMETQDTSSRVHPTQKPVELAVWFFERWSKQGDIVADVYLGSGTTLAACEQTNRTGYGMEIDPGYVAVILERLAGMGLEPKLISDPMDH
jgi:DNA modification methylase